MTGNKWTFLLVRGENQPVKQYSVSTQTLRGLLILSSLIAIFMIGLALSSGVEVMARVEARELHTKNEALDRAMRISEASQAWKLLTRKCFRLVSVDQD